MSIQTTKLLTAEEARNIARDSNCQLNRLAKEIEVAAKENRNQLFWCVYDTQPIVKDSIINALKLNGYTVELLKEEADSDVVTSLKVSW